MYCSKCGAENHEDVKFCSQCGEKFGSPSPIAQNDDKAVETAPVLPRLWSPTLALIWSLFLSPLFGAYIVSKNWEQIGERGRAGSASFWLWGGVGVYIVSILTLPEAVVGIGFVWFLLWYIFSLRAHAKFIKTEMGDNYERKSWVKPIFVAIVLWIVAMFIYGAIMVAKDPYGEGLSQNAGSSPASLEEYEESAVRLNYRSAQLGDYEHGTLVYVNGQVNQIIDQRTAMLQTEHHEFIGYLGQPVLLRFSESPRLIESDVVVIMGRYAGTRDYQTVLGNETSSPVIHVDHYSSK